MSQSILMAVRIDITVSQPIEIALGEIKTVSHSIKIASPEI